MTLSCKDADGNEAFYKDCFTNRHQVMVQKLEKFLLETEDHNRFRTYYLVIWVLIPLSLVFQFLYAVFLGAGDLNILSLISDKH